MCNLYSITTNQSAIAALFRVMNRYVGSLPPMPGVFPDYPAPVVRNVGNEREMTLMRWGMPPPPTNIRKTGALCHSTASRNTPPTPIRRQAGRTSCGSL
jgi:putative SOS response-associated peptidase YedK